ncbi:MAG: alanine racemase [Anaerolineaceae bacterium]
MDTDANSIWLEINLGAIRRNIRKIAQITQRPVMAVVKANAYGHGLFEVAKAAEKAGIARLCVARLEEAIALRDAGIIAPILVLGFTSPLDVPKAMQRSISLALFNAELAPQYEEAAQFAEGNLNVHIKVDTGMGRLGIFPENSVEFVSQVSRMKKITIEGLFTHFASADEPQKGTTDDQVVRFDQVILGLEKVGIRPAIIHADNSAGSLYYSKARYDAVRPGNAIYGLNPSSEAPLPEGFEPALAWKTRLTSVKILPPGSGISYGHRYITKANERIGTSAVGYADGLRRKLGNVALVHGHRVNQVGMVCMDQTMWQLDEIPDAKVGDEVVLIGSQGDQRITAEEVAASWETINYEVVCGLSARVPRYYFDE